MSRKRLLETITLLWALKPIVEDRRENKIPSIADTTRQLTIKHEQEIAIYLAFISSITDDPNRVTSVCIEEDLGGRRLIIRVASNNGDLSEVKQGLERIASILEQASQRGL